MTQSQSTSNDISAKQALRNIIGSTKKTVVTGDAPKTKKFDPIADQDNKLMVLLDLSLVIKSKISNTNALDDGEENPKIRHSETPRVHVYLSKKRVYQYSEKLKAKRLKLEAQMADLKDEEAKEVRHGKATLIKETYTTSFKS